MIVLNSVVKTNKQNQIGISCFTAGLQTVTKAVVYATKNIRDGESTQKELIPRL